MEQGCDWILRLSTVALFGSAAACTASHDIAVDDAEILAARSETTASAARSSAARGALAGQGALGVGRGGSQLADSVPAGTGRGGDPDNFIFSQDAVRNYDVRVDPEDWAHINETAYLEEYIPGRLVFEGTEYPLALRFKGFRGSLFSCFRFDEQGNATARVCDRLPIKLSFNEYDEEGRFFGLKKLNFHALRNDPSLMRDRLSYAVFRASGVPAPRAVHATLTVNGEPLGLFALVEQVDGRFARNAFEEGGEGNIYKERWPTSSTVADYFISGLESNKDEADVSAMQAFALDLAAATDETIEGVLREHTNFDALMRYLAVDRAIHHWDGPLAFRCRTPEQIPALPPQVFEAQTPALGWETCQNKNYFWYEEKDSGKLWLVPWDMDFAWNSFSQFGDWRSVPDRCEVAPQGRPPRCDRLVDWFATMLYPHYVEAGRELMSDEGALRLPVLMSWLDRWYEQIAPYTEPGRVAFGAFLLGAELENRLRAFADELSD